MIDSAGLGIELFYGYFKETGYLMHPHKHTVAKSDSLNGVKA
jgi:hypothetical protein